MTIRQRVLIPMIVFTVFAASIVLISDIFQFSRYVEEDVGKRLDMAYHSAMSEISNIEAQVNAAAIYLSNDTYIISALKEGDDSKILARARQLNNNTGIESCIITDNTGIIRVSTHKVEMSGMDATVLPSAASALSGQPMTAIEPGMSVSLVISSAAPVYSDRGEILGVVIAGFPLSTESFVDSIKALTGCEVSICRDDVRVATTLKQEGGSRAIGTKVPEEISSVVLSGDTYSGKVEVISSKLTSKYYPLFGEDRQVVGMLLFGRYTIEATDTIVSFILMGLIILLPLSVLLWFMISYITGRIVMPINEAAEVLSRISTGDFDARVLGSYKGDLAQIKNSVNNTASSLSLYLSEKMSAEHAAHESELAKARAEQASIVKSEFLASMSHEIRTPMNAIIGMSELLHEENLSEKQHEYVKDIRTASTALLGIINDILDMSKIEAGRLTLSPAHFEFLPFINGLVSMMSYTARSKSLEFIYETNNALPNCVFGDDVRLRQILINLLSNAIKFTDTGFVRLYVSYEDGVFRFEVTDTGIGVKESEIEYLFVSFEQLDSEKNRYKQGTGLGLPISKSLVEMMNGEISVSSVYGEGSTFTVTIPMPIGDESQLVCDASTLERLSAEDAAVLLVDDNSGNLSVGRGLLRLSGIVCDTATSGAQALEMIMEKDYDLVFLDHMMPDIDGLEVTRRIRAMGGKYEKLILIALSANAMSGAREMYINSGMDDFLAKPIERTLLVKTLKKWLPPEKVHLAERRSAPRADTRNDEVIKRIRQIEEINVSAALKLTGGSLEVYKSSLRQITKTLPEMVESMARHLENGGLERFAILVHGVKSTLAAIGSRALSEQALGMETEAGAGNLEYCRERFPEFAERVISLQVRLSEVLAEEPVVPKYAGEPEMLGKKLKEVVGCLEDFDDETAQEIIGFLFEHDFGGQVNDLLRELEKHVQVFEYEKAAELAEEIKKTIMCGDRNG